jgi:hypothetical protein
MSNQSDFLKNEFWILSWNASVQRALKYNPKKTVSERVKFREHLIEYCDKEIIPKYIDGQSEIEHLSNIMRVCDEANKYNDCDLLSKPYNIGIAQKLLNLQLKYLWCAGLVKQPPHCPVDRIILSKTSLKNKLNWTQIETLGEYKKAIQAIVHTANGMPIALWELEEYNRRNSKR